MRIFYPSLRLAVAAAGASTLLSGALAAPPARHNHAAGAPPSYSKALHAKPGSSGLTGAGMHIPLDEIIPLSQIHPGMVGYGLTVFHGTKVERFGVKVIDILHKQYMGGDLILIRMSGGPISNRGANIIAGMSGSPVYFKGRLAGAVSMGYEWPKEPVAMVTPIQSMEEAFSPRLPTKPEFSALPWSREPAQFFSQGFAGSTVTTNDHSDEFWRNRFSEAASYWGMGSMGGDAASEGAMGFQPLPTPLFTSGLSPQLVSRLGRVLSPMGFRAVPGMGGGNASAAASNEKIVPGSMVGVLFCTGDVELGGFGTVTYRKGNRILAFGHPMQELGPIDFPLSTSYVADVFSAYPRSEKMCLPGKLIGALQQDRPWSVMGTLGKPAHTIPLTIAIDDEATGAARTFHIQCANHPLMTSLIADVASQEAITEARNYPGDSMVDVRVEVDSKGLAPIVRTNTYFDYFNPQAVSEPSLGDMDHILDILQNNPFRQVSLGAIKVSMHIHPGRKMSSIERIAINKSTVAPGDHVHVDVSLRPYKGTSYVVPLDVQIPADAPNGAATLMITGGMLSPAPGLPSVGGGFSFVLGGGPPPGGSDPAANLQEMIDRYLKTEKNTDLVGRVVLTASPSLNINGERLYNLPPALAAALHSPRATGSFPLPDEAKTIKHMAEMIIGAQGVPITIQRQDTGGQPVENHSTVAPVIKHSPPDIPLPTPKTPAGGASTIVPGGQTTLATGTVQPVPVDINGGDGAEPGAGVIVPPDSASPPPPPSTTPKTSSTDPDITISATTTAPAETSPDAAVKKLQTWTLRSQSDFEAGHGEGVAVGSLGDLAIAPRFGHMQSLEKEDFVWVARPDANGGMLLGTGNNGEVYRQDTGHNLSVALKTHELDVLSLAQAPDGSEYAGTAPHGLIYHFPAVGGGVNETAFFKTGKQYVLALAVDAAGNVYAGTNGGAIFKINSAGKGSIWYQSTESHICALDIAPNGDILAGASPSGLVYRITPEGKASVVWDADDTSVSSLLALPGGDIMVGTAPKGIVERIHEDGTNPVQVLKTDVSVHDMARAGDRVYVASGPGLYEVLPSNEIRKIQKEGDQEMLTVGASPNGDLVAGTGNLAGIYSIVRQPTENSYRTSIRDAGSIAIWGHVRWSGDLAAGSSVAFQSRTGNSAIPDNTWSPWTAVTPGTDGDTVVSPKGRYIQLRTLLSSSVGGPSPIVRSISLTYMPENRPPTLTLTSPTAGTVLHGKTDIAWTGADPDSDALIYTAFYSSDGGLTWKPAAIADKGGKALTTEMTDATYQWDTSGLKDGNYLLKIVVSDRRSNPDNPMEAAQIAGPFQVINSQPTVIIPALAVKTLPDGSVTFSGTADGKGSTIVGVSYRIDGGAWFSAASDTGLFDAQQASFKVQTAPLAAGDHKIEVQAINAAGDKTTITVPGKSTSPVTPVTPTPAPATPIKPDTTPAPKPDATPKPKPDTTPKPGTKGGAAGQVA